MYFQKEKIVSTLKKGNCKLYASDECFHVNKSSRWSPEDIDRCNKTVPRNEGELLEWIDPEATMTALFTAGYVISDSYQKSLLAKEYRLAAKESLLAAKESK